MIILILFAAMMQQWECQPSNPMHCWVMGTMQSVDISTIIEKQEPLDVPAIHPIHKIIAPQDMTLTEGGWVCYQKGKEVACRTLLKEGTDWTCADKSRVLLTAEDGSKHCILFKGREAK